MGAGKQGPVRTEPCAQQGHNKYSWAGHPTQPLVFQRRQAHSYRAGQWPTVENPGLLSPATPYPAWQSPEELLRPTLMTPRDVRDVVTTSARSV